MKKLLLLFAAMLLCSLAHSQEAEGNGSYADFQLIPRFDFNPYFTPGDKSDGSSGHTFGNSSIYTLIEGAFGEHVSFTLNNHWMTVPTSDWGDTKALYEGTLYSNTNNWVDIAKVDLTFGNWQISLGKDCMATGGFEYDAWDVDTDFLINSEGNIMLASNLWSNLPSYQWGAGVGYNIADHTNLTLQMLTSPFGERPFASKLFVYSFKWTGNYGPFSNIWSATMAPRADGATEWLIALSQQAELGDFTVGLDWYNVADVDYDDDDAPCGFIHGNTFRPRLAYAPTEEFECGLYANIYNLAGAPLSDFNIGASVHYRPIETIQLHAAAGWDWTTNCVSALAGIKVNFHFLSL